MYVWEAGTAGSPAVLFLQGAGASGRMWREHFARLADRFYCLAPDLPGFGRSNQLAPLSRSETADLVAQLIRERVPQQQAHLVGLSWGGGITHTMLDHYPELVDKAVIDGAGVLSAWEGKLIVLGVIVISPFLHTAPIVRFFGDMIGMDDEGRTDLRASAPKAFRRAFIEGFKPCSLQTEITVASPTLLVAGEQETVVRRSHGALAALMPHAVARYVPEVGHGWLAKKTKLHVDMVEAWLTGQELPDELVIESASASAIRWVLRQAEP